MLGLSINPFAVVVSALAASLIDAGCLLVYLAVMGASVGGWQ